MVLFFSLARCSDKCKGWPAFVGSIFFIGVLTAVIGDVAAHFGCISHIKDSITAITIVALGTSVPGLNEYLTAPTRCILGCCIIIAFVWLSYYSCSAVSNIITHFFGYN